MQTMLSHQNAMIRCLGLIYLRLNCPPGQIWQWFEDMMDDEAEVVVTPTPNLRHSKVFLV